MKRRFDTHFFITVLPPSIPAPLPSTGASTAGTISTPIVSSDGQETVSADWLTPSSAMSRTLQHTRQLQGSDAREDLPSLILFPPQFYLLAELASTKSYASLLIPGTAIVQPRSVVSFEPQLKPVLTSTGEERPATVLPGDPAHSQTAKLYPSASPSARHRTYVLLPSKEKGKGPPLGLTVMGIERLGLEGVLGAKGEWSDLIEGDVGVKTGPKL
jgi:nucleoside diphosphate-linked moiety X motif protein 19